MADAKTWGSFPYEEILTDQDFGADTLVQGSPSRVYVEFFGEITQEREDGTILQGYTPDEARRFASMLNAAANVAEGN